MPLLRNAPNTSQKRSKKRGDQSPILMHFARNSYSGVVYLSRGYSRYFEEMMLKAFGLKKSQPYNSYYYQSDFRILTVCSIAIGTRSRLFGVVKCAIERFLPIMLRMMLELQPL